MKHLQVCSEHDPNLNVVFAWSVDHKKKKKKSFHFEYDEEKACNVFNFDELHKVSKVVCKNLNKVIDTNYYPVEKF